MKLQALVISSNSSGGTGFQRLGWGPVCCVFLDGKEAELRINHQHTEPSSINLLFRNRHCFKGKLKAINKQACLGSLGA